MKVIIAFAMVMAGFLAYPVERKPAKPSSNGIQMQPPVTDTELAAARARGAWLIRAASRAAHRS